MPVRFCKHCLLLDEGVFPRQFLKRVNGRHLVKHIKHDLNKGGVNDDQVYKIACEEKRIIVTYNVKDFKNLAIKSKNTGVIGVSQNLTPDQLDVKLNSLLSKSSEKSLYGKYTSLG